MTIHIGLNTEENRIHFETRSPCLVGDSMSKFRVSKTEQTEIIIFNLSGAFFENLRLIKENCARMRESKMDTEL